MDIEEQKKRFEDFKKQYSDDFLEECLDDLKIDDAFHRATMKDVLYKAGTSYILFDNMRKKYLPKKEIQDRYKAINKPLKQLKEKWLELWEENIFDFSILYDGAYTEFSKNVNQYQNNKLINDFVSCYNNKFFEKFSEFLEFIIFLDNANNALAENIRGSSIKGTHPEENWLRNVKPYWEKYSPIAFIAGAHYPAPIGYNSEAVLILNKLMQQMDNTVEKKTIGNTLDRINKLDRKKAS